MVRIYINKQFLFLFICVLAVMPSFCQLSTSNWYVGNTVAGEWILFKKVYISDGDYRFTTRSVASEESQTVHLELNNHILSSGVKIPYNENSQLELVHLGHTYIQTGYYDIKLVFETGNVNCDMIFIRKDDGTSSSVSDNDITYSINHNDGMHIAPIGGAWGASSHLAKGGEHGDQDEAWYDENHNLFTRKQVLSWYKQQIYAYTPEVTDQAMDMYVSEQVEAKVDFIFSHGRGENDFENDIEDRRYIAGIGGYGCRQLKKLVESINRNAFAKGNLKIAYFIDNAVFPLAVKQYLGKIMNWGDPDCQEFIWNYCFKNFYETIPREMLFERSPGIIPIQLWSANANYDYSVGDHKILEFLEYIKDKMIKTYGLEPSFILDKTFFERDPRTKEIADGVQSWFIWGNEIITYETFENKKYGFALNGGRLPMRGVWENDWNPETNTGTHHNNTTDYYHSSLKTDNSPSIRPIYKYGFENNFEWLVNESWFDWQEGSTWYRSDHSDYAWPNQYIALEREFADHDSESILLEAEACDTYYDRSKGNSGGAYRVNWYSELDKDYYSVDMGIDLDIYRPLHQLAEPKEGGSPSGEIMQISAGQFDVWAIDADGKIVCQEVDGHPIDWKRINTDLPNVKKIALGRHHAWALTTDNKVMKTELPRGWDFNSCNGWSDITGNKPMINIDLNMSRGWSVDEGGNVYYRDYSAKMDWQKIPGNLKSLTADDEFVWGFTKNDSIVCMSVQSKNKWDTIPNPYHLIKLEAGATEVWGINELNEVYRINSSGDGDWEYVTKGYNNVSVGYEQVWLSDSNGKMIYYDLKGFKNLTTFARDKTDLIPTTVKPTEIQVSKLNVFPNPFKNEVNLSIYSDQGKQFASINLYGLDGRLYRSEMKLVQQGFNEIKIDDLEPLIPGIYILNVIVGSENQRIKLVKVNE